MLRQQSPFPHISALLFGVQIVTCSSGSEYLCLCLCESTEVREALGKKAFSHELKSQTDAAVTIGGQFLSTALQVVVVVPGVYECMCMCVVYMGGNEYYTVAFA